MIFVIVGDRIFVVVVEMKVVEFEIVLFDLFVVVVYYVVGEQSFVVFLVFVVVVDIVIFVVVEWWVVLLFGEYLCLFDLCFVFDWDCWEVFDFVFVFVVVLFFVE